MVIDKELPIINALWIGDQLGAMSRACLTSFLMRGHQVYLYTYGQVKDLPDGVQIKDANQIIDKSKIIKHRKTGSYALFSDIFRYELLRQTDNNNIYVDCDVYCIKPLSVPKHGYLLGYEDDYTINGAVLALPSDSDLLRSLLNIAYDPTFIPPWFSKSKQIKLKIKKSFRISVNIEDMPWGIIGPSAITYYVNQLKLEDYVEDIDLFYPIHCKSVVSFLTKYQLDIKEVLTSRTQCIHLYNEMLKGIDTKKLSDKTILFKMLKNFY
ncbi:galactosyltransferase Lgt5 [Ignatzschineria cameli]|uniref:galactosyltransferase Lgt5 n=1 Tax=Ignatzschineria cameli TaxID=2182793 RepID=UPI001EFD314A|nr:galactosyltransferase Lgt5 [Ignatzschineria cameli]